MAGAAKGQAQWPGESLSIPVEGMTCASCVNRVERFLRKTDGVVEANVNLATEQARVRFDPQLVGRDELTRAVEASGYSVRDSAEDLPALLVEDVE